MNKAIAAVIGVMFLGHFSATPAKADVFCDFLGNSPTIQDAQDLIYATGLAAYKSSIDGERAAQFLMDDVTENCPEHISVLYAAAASMG